MSDTSSEYFMYTFDDGSTFVVRVDLHDDCEKNGGAGSCSLLGVSPKMKRKK